jgi:hypothetical protein
LLRHCSAGNETQKGDGRRRRAKDVAKRAVAKLAIQQHDDGYLSMSVRCCAECRLVAVDGAPNQAALAPAPKRHPMTGNCGNSVSAP